LRIRTLVLLLLVPATAAFAQSLGDVARREKKRREQNQREGAPIHVITDSEVTTAGGGPPGEIDLGLSDSDTDADADADADSPDRSEHGVAQTGSDPARLPPDFVLPDRQGRTFSLRDLRGRPVLVDFWASWCGPCKKTMPEIERLHRKYGSRLQVVGINIEGRSPDVLAYLDNGGYSFRVLFDSGNWKGSTVTRYGVSSIPRTFLLDREGHILFSGHPNGLRQEQIEAALEE
jgi:thiol-disulfide isomerase/thioredoxin